MSSVKVLLWFCLTLACICCADFQEREFIKRELSGRLIELEDIHHGQFFLYIVDIKTKDTVRYALRISRFIRENAIEVGDSISKEAESHTTWFYKKKNGKYQRVAELYYH